MSSPSKTERWPETADKKLPQELALLRSDRATANQSDGTRLSLVVNFTSHVPRATKEESVAVMCIDGDAALPPRINHEGRSGEKIFHGQETHSPRAQEPLSILVRVASLRHVVHFCRSIKLDRSFSIEAWNRYGNK